MTAPSVASGPGRAPISFLLRWGVDRPAGWALIAFATWFFYAQFIASVGWNAIELIIAQHLLDHGAFATSIDYPSAVTWRPVAPTLLVTLLRSVTDNPLLIYRWVCGLALAALVASLFAAAHLLWGRVAAHLTAALTLTCPGLTIFLINHPHSYSHLGALLWLGPALLLSLRLLQRVDTAATPSAGGYALTGLAWGLCYLSRAELLLFAGLHGAMLAWLHWRHRRPWRPLAAYAAAFALVFAAYNIHASREADRGALLIRKSIYGFYASQGWVDAAPNAPGGDIEAAGYQRAIELYGDPAANRESLAVAIVRHPALVLQRVGLNLAAFYRRLLDPGMFPGLWLAGAVLGLALGISRRASASERRAVLFLSGTFIAAHFVLLFHIDARYLVIALPSLLLLAGFAVHALAPRNRPLLVTLLVLVAVLPARTTLEHLRAHPERDGVSVAAMRSFGAHFRSTVPAPHLTTNREPHLDFEAPDASPLCAEDQFLLAYFSHTAWVNGGADGAFPRGRLYSYRACPTDYVYVPFARAATRGGRVIADYENPILGRYALVQLNP